MKMPWMLKSSKYFVPDESFSLLENPNLVAEIGEDLNSVVFKGDWQHRITHSRSGILAFDTAGSFPADGSD